MRRKIRNSLSFILLVVVGGLVGYFGANFLLESSPADDIYTFSLTEKILLIASLFPVIWLVILAHESGHVLGGLAAGDDFGFMAAGPLYVENEQGRLQIRYNRHLTLWGGLAFTLPNSTENFRLRRLILVGGGPLASLLLGLGLLWCVGLPGDLPPNLSNAMAICLQALQFMAIISLFIFVATIIPSRMGGFMSDGMQLLLLFRNNAEAKAYAAFLHLFAQTKQGTRPADLSTEHLQTLAAFPDSSSRGVGANLYRFYHHLDKGESTEAETYLQLVEKHLGAYPAGFQADIWVEIYLYELLFLNKTEREESLWEKFENRVATKKSESAILAKATHAWHHGQPEQAQKLIEEGLQLIAVGKTWEKGLAPLRTLVYEKLRQQLEG